MFFVFEPKQNFQYLNKLSNEHHFVNYNKTYSTRRDRKSVWDKHILERKELKTNNGS